jgi:hypothetical protein
VPATPLYFACWDIGMAKTSFDAFLGKVEIKRRRTFRNLWAVFIYGDKTISFIYIKEVPKIVAFSSAL